MDTKESSAPAHPAPLQTKKGTRCDVCGISSYQRTLIGLRNDRRRNGPRFCLPHHPDTMATLSSLRVQSL